MSVDERLRSGLARNARSFEPDVEARLAELHRRADPRQRVSLRRMAAIASVAASVIAVAVLTVAVARSSSRSQPTIRPGLPSEIRSQPLVGTWTLTVPSSEPARAGHLVGQWVMTLDNDSTVRMRAPQDYRGVLSGALFSSTSSGLFRTSLFNQDLCSGLGPGSYHWTRVGSDLRLTATDDRCTARVLVLGSQDWRASH